MYDIIYFFTQKPSKEKVKLGWGWHPHVFTTVQCLIMKHDLPYERFALFKAYKIVRSYLVKGFKHPAKRMLGKRTLTYNEVSTMLKDL